MRRPPVRRRSGAVPRRTAALMALVILVGLVFTGRLLQVQTLDAPTLARAALGNRLVSLTLPAQRGEITDASGRVLARSVERYDVTADPTLFTGPTKAAPTLLSPATAAARLAPVLGVDAQALARTLTPGTGADPSHFAYVAKGVTPQVWSRVAALHVPGLYRQRDDERTYPAGAVAGNLVGYLSADGTPLGGLEYSQDRLLTGTDGHETYERGKDGTRIPMGEFTHTAAQDGSSVRLTLDEDVQYAAQQAIDAQVGSTGAEWGSVVVMTKDQKVLAMAQSGTMDPNDPSATPVADRHAIALQDVVEPGSTGKVITASALIQEGLATPSTRVVVPGSLVIPGIGKPISDAEAHGDERLTLAGIIAQSSNIGTVMLGRELTRDQRYDYLRAFGVGSEQLHLPGESGGILAPAAKWDGRQQYTVLFGQGYAVTTLQSASVYATIANGGVRVTPQLIAGTTDARGRYHPAAARASTRVVSTSTAQQVVGMLQDVVTSEGTGTNANVAGFQVAGKTGTADDLSYEATHAGQKAYTSSFIGMAPAADPQLVVAVTLQHPQTSHYGGTVAAPVFSQVMSAALADTRTAPVASTAPLPALTW